MESRSEFLVTAERHKTDTHFSDSHLPHPRRIRAAPFVIRHPAFIIRRCRGEKAERLLHHRRRSERRHRRIRASARENAEHRSPCRTRCALRSCVLPVPAVRAEPELHAHRAVSEQHGYPRKRAAFPADDSVCGKPATGVPSRRLPRRPHRPALSLQRAELDRHKWSRRSRLLENGEQSRELRPHAGGAGNLQPHAGTIRRHAELARIEESRREAHRQHGSRGRRVGAGALRKAVKATFPSDGKTPELRDGTWAPNPTDP